MTASGPIRRSGSRGPCSRPPVGLPANASARSTRLTVTRTGTVDALLLATLEHARDQLDRDRPFLSVPLLAGAMGISQAKAILLLTRLAELGLFEGTGAAPYFRITGCGRSLLDRADPGAATPRRTSTA